MSADNWTTCPQCLKNEKEKRETLLSELQEDYGKISIEEFNEKQNKINKGFDCVINSTLREDYDIGIADNKFEISYGASCDVCGFSCQFRTSDKLNLK